MVVQSVDNQPPDPGPELTADLSNTSVSAVPPTSDLQPQPPKDNYIVMDSPRIPNDTVTTDTENVDKSESTVPIATTSAKQSCDTSSSSNNVEDTVVDTEPIATKDSNEVVSCDKPVECTPSEDSVKAKTREEPMDST